MKQQSTHTHTARSLSHTVLNKEWDVVGGLYWSYWNYPVCEQTSL